MAPADKSVQEHNPPPVPAVSGPSSRWLPWPILSLFQFGLILGLVSLWWQLRPSADVHQEETASAPTPAKVAAPLGSEPTQAPPGTINAESLTRAESLLREGRF